MVEVAHGREVEASMRVGGGSPAPAFRRRRRVLVGVVVALFAVGVAGAAVEARRMLVVEEAPAVAAGGIPVAPQYAFEAGRDGEGRLSRPVSADIAGGRLYVTDSVAGHVAVFRDDGAFDRVIGAGRLQVPVYVAVSADGAELYVTDRRLGALLAFDAADGSFVETITPGFPWAPIAVEAVDDGSLLVSDVAGRHRIVRLLRDGTVVSEIPGTAVDAPLELDFPNAVEMVGDHVWVSDSNNRRLLEFDEDGALVRSVPLGRLIRGFDVMPGEDGGPVHFALADSFSHQVVLITDAGAEVARFGGPGTEGAHLAFPNDVVVHDGAAWVVDTGNARVAAWQWGEATRPEAAVLWPRGPSGLLLVSALLLSSPLGLLLLLRPVSVAASPASIPMLSIRGADTHRWRPVR
ncbi:MAG TPA: hypothetical protein VFH17_00265, partial [Coriobacteriia bacterium]|nr:hypothetical protein [Coriobacteriia bacterium]